MLSYKLSRSIKHALWMGTAATLSTAYCSTAIAANAASDSDSMDEVVVTGSRIAGSLLGSSTPVQVLTETDLVSGSVNASDFLRNLPGVGISGFSSANSNFATSSAGVNTINLRNLGDSRTLVLVNGRRFVPGVAGDSAVDFNMIPTDFIDHIEVITGGASAVYGSEAISGVVNVIYKKDFEGISVRGQVGSATEGGSGRVMGALTAGAKVADGRGNILINFTHDEDKGLYSRQRTISEQDYFVSAAPAGYSPARSSYVPQGRFFAGDHDYTFDRSNNLITDDYTTLRDGFNRNGIRRITTPTDRNLFSAMFNYDIAEKHHFNSEFTYGLTTTHSELEPFPLGTNEVYQVDAGSGINGLPITNAYIPKAISDYITQYNADAAVANAANADGDPTVDDVPLIDGIDFRKRLTGVANRASDSRRQAIRAVIGFNGSLFGDWTYDSYYMFGRTTDAQVSSGQVNVQNFRYALDSVHSDPNDPSSPIVCRDHVAQIFGCVPINLFGFDSITPAAAAYVAAPVTRDVTIGEEVLSASVQGPIAKLPAGDWKVAAGVEYRYEKSEEIWDALTNQGLNAGNVLPNVYGAYHVKEAFAETIVPLLSNVALVKDLSVNAALRFADYSTVGNTNAFKIGFDWALDSNFRVRGTYSTATRAPNIGELYGGRAQTFPTGIQDPCDGVTPGSTDKFSAACLSVPAISQAANGAGFTYDLLDYQKITGFDGSNPALTAEKAKTLTFGVVITPAAIPKLAITLDYFDIKIDDAVSTIDRQSSIDECLLTKKDAFCSNVTRSLVSGKVIQVDATNVNVASLRTSGVDATIRYGWDFNKFGGLSAALTWTYLTKLEKTNFEGAPLFDNIGQLNGDGRLGAGFKNKGMLSLAYETGGFTATWRTKYLSAIQDTSDPDNAPPDVINNVPAYMYHDIQLKYSFKPKSLKLETDFYVGADNLFDKKPPHLVSGTASDITGTETAADTYDAIGRFVYAGFGVKF